MSNRCKIEVKWRQFDDEWETIYVGPWDQHAVTLFDSTKAFSKACHPFPDLPPANVEGERLASTHPREYGG